MTATQPPAVRVERAGEAEWRIAELLARMTLEEKIGQLTLVPGGGGHVPPSLAEEIRAGRIGAVLNEVDPGTVTELQRLAREESRLGIPLLVGRDVIHGFRTIFPIPLGQAATWSPALVERGARVAALEAAAAGVNWTFAPMVDIGRDPRWGRVAECLGEDPLLASRLAEAMIRGFQGEDLAQPGSIAACVKHFAGYGACEAGRDYAATSLPETELRNVHLRPFRAAVAAGVASVMTSFSDVNGLPATANPLLLRDILRREWGFDGLVVSDWESVPQLAVHGLTADDRASAREAALAGCDMEMTSRTYTDHLPALVRAAEVPPAQLDAMVANVLRTKLRLGLLERAPALSVTLPAPLNDAHRAAAYEAAVASVVLLKNDRAVLPLDPARLRSLAVIGPLADDGHEQMGTWVFDGRAEDSATILPALRARAGEQVEVRYARGVDTTRSLGQEGFDQAVAVAQDADAVVLCLGEESILSGKRTAARTSGSPGAQAALVARLARLGKPLILVVLAGRALALAEVVPQVDALLYAWHPGTMGGPAIADLLFGVSAPSGRLPVSLPRAVGQVPIYYAQRRTGKPAWPAQVIPLDAIPARAGQTSVGNTSYHLDAGFTPLYPFGYGLSYTTFGYAALALSDTVLRRRSALVVSVEVTNTGPRAGEDVVQCYVGDPVASLTRPVRELVAFARVALAAGERRTVHFTLTAADLAFHGRDHRLRAEAGEFRVWVGGNAEATLEARFHLVDDAGHGDLAR
ncbi:MAG: glycoside hydrolase family 3 C-terminal domain-containing protein [Gemmatimonadetes bacterium]|nr:glycoside hydrolase family 3 C-terminal domain-containing protein [Gemmatimonadota bacterium]